MKKVGKPVFFIVVILIAALTVLSFFGASSTYGDITKPYVKGAADIRWGIDIRGGVDVTFTPPADLMDQVTPDQMRAAEAIIKVRLVSQNITDSEVYTDTSRNRIIVRFPWKADEVDFNPEQAVKELGETALLTFREGNSIDGPVVIEGKHVDIAQAAPDPEGKGYVVELTLTEEGRTLFAEATGRLINQNISIWMDENLISAPVVNSRIDTPTAIITGGPQGFTREDATDLANKISGGALPFKLETKDFSSISPTLGTGARDAMVTAGIIAFCLVAAFIILIYRMCGVVATIALAGQVAGMIACLTGFFANFPSFTLTLPGIAGIILSIGMGVDANVITSERIREELAAGRNLNAAIDSGFRRTFAAIFDGNITMVLVAVILMGAFGPPNSAFGTFFNPIFKWFGATATGAIYSFGFTLITGVILNFIMGVTASRLMLKSISKFKAFQNPWLYGGKKQEAVQEPAKKSWDIVGNRKKWFTISGTLIALTLVASLVLGVKLDIQFSGGTIATYSFSGDIDMKEFGDTVSAALGQNVTVREQQDIATGLMNYEVTLSAKDGVTPDQQAAVTTALTEKYPDNNVEITKISNVDPTIGADFLKKSLAAVALASLLMIVYIAFRFRKMNGWSAGVISVMALLHDAIIAYAVFVVCGFPLNDSFIAVILTILGYSINNTIIIYDRIRENQKLLPPKTSYQELVNLSINQSMRRSVNTSVSTVLAMLCVCVMSVLFHVESIMTFSLPLLVGMLAGFFSSVFLSGSLWGWWQERKDPKAKGKAAA